MDRLNALYEELMWDTDDVLEFSADYDNDQIIIRNRTREIEIEEGTRKSHNLRYNKYKDKRSYIKK